MPVKKYRIDLTAQERGTLLGLIRSGKTAARQVMRARILLLAGEHYSDEEIMEGLSVSRPTVAKMRQKYQEHQGAQIRGLVQEAARPGHPAKVDSRLSAHVAGVACSGAPTGAARWTLELIADRVVELNLVDTISRERVRQALKKRTRALAPAAVGYREDYGRVPVA